MHDIDDDIKEIKMRRHFQPTDAPWVPCEHCGSRVYPQPLRKDSAEYAQGQTEIFEKLCTRCLLKK